MKILSIETSCDETAISILEADVSFDDKDNPIKFKILANNLISQIDIHKEYGGVFPALAKREHAKNLIPILAKTLQEASLGNPTTKCSTIDDEICKILEREPVLLELFLKYIPTIEIPEIDAIAVTQGPGLEPALWVGINFAKALSLIWNKPLIPVNHMEGHLLSAFTSRKKKFSTCLSADRFSFFQFLPRRQAGSKSKIRKFEIKNPQFPMIGLLISGGHTELILMKDWMKYKKIGQTLDDAVGEAFDKAARMMELSYPGGPEISKLAEIERKNPFSAQSAKWEIKLPRPMLHTDDFNFSFSGLKTAVLYLIKKLKEKNNWEELPIEIKQKIAREFEDAVVEILLKKSKKAVEKYGAKTLILGGGVIANSQIRQNFQALENSDLKVLMPEIEFSTDNAVMIGMAGYFQYLTCLPIRQEQKKKGQSQTAIDLLKLSADGNLSF